MEKNGDARRQARGRRNAWYRSRRGDDAALRGRLRELAQQHRRFGYRRLHILLLRDGVRVNRKRTQRLYTEEGLTVRKRKSRRRAVGVRVPLPVLALPNELAETPQRFAAGSSAVLSWAGKAGIDWHAPTSRRRSGAPSTPWAAPAIRR